MGADIHGPFIEYRAYKADSRNGEIWYPVATMNGDRNYRLFGLLAGVRGPDPLFEPRGMPPAPGWDVVAHVGGRDKSGAWLDDYCHSRSWLTLDEMRAVVAAYPDPTGVYGDQSEANLMVALMAAAEEYHGAPTRAVFCFDN